MSAHLEHEIRCWLYFESRVHRIDYCTRCRVWENQRWLQGFWAWATEEEMESPVLKWQKPRVEVLVGEGNRSQFGTWKFKILKILNLLCHNFLSIKGLIILHIVMVRIWEVNIPNSKQNNRDSGVEKSKLIKNSHYIIKLLPNPLGIVYENLNIIHRGFSWWDFNWKGFSLEDV